MARLPADITVSLESCVIAVCASVVAKCKTRVPSFLSVAHSPRTRLRAGWTMIRLELDWGWKGGREGELLYVVLAWPAENCWSISGSPIVDHTDDVLVFRAGEMDDLSLVDGTSRCVQDPTLRGALVWAGCFSSCGVSGRENASACGGEAVVGGGRCFFFVLRATPSNVRVGIHTVICTRFDRSPRVCV